MLQLSLFNKLLPKLMCWAIAILLSACASQQASVKRANELLLCKKNCQQHLIACSQICHNNCQECSQSAHCKAAHNYYRYRHQQYVQGGILARELNSYRDPLQCRKITCDCAADYKVCTQSCEGLIRKRLQAAPICC